MSLSKNLRFWPAILLGVLGLIALTSTSFAQATHSEDVPDLTKPFDEQEKDNQRPVMLDIGWSPKFPVFGNAVGTSNGKKVYFTISAYGRDPEGDILKYVFQTESETWGPTFDSTVPVTRIGGPGIVEITVTAIDRKGARSAPMTKILQVLDPVDEELNNIIRDVVDFLNSDQRGDLRALKTRDITIEEGGQGPANVETAQSTIDGATPTARSIINGATPWKDDRVQVCVRQYLDRVAFPVENRLDPGKFTHIDEWGRLLGPNLHATGPVEGFWDNPTHFVWSQYGSDRATLRYGASLRAYVADCLAGLIGDTSTATTAGGGHSISDLYDEAKAAIEEGNAHFRNGDVAGARASYQKALDALRRAQQADVNGKYAQNLADAIALVERNLARVHASAPSNAGGIGPGLVVGENVHKAFEVLARSNAVAFSNLENVSTGLHNSLRLGNTTITLRTTEFRYPLPVRRAPAGTPVAVLPYSYVNSPANHRFMGVSASRVPDGQSKYEFVLSKPASHVGLMRNWNSYSLTRFYNAAGRLLAEYRNRANSEFVAYVADRPENQVARIEFDGVPEHSSSTSNKLFQVGEVDNLYVGTPTALGQRGQEPGGPPEKGEHDGDVSLAAIYRGLDADVVGNLSRASPDGLRDGHFTLALDTAGEEKVVDGIFIQSAREDGEPTNLRWDTVPGGYWILGVYRNGRRLNPTDVAIKDAVRGVARYEVYGNAEDTQWFRPGSYFRVTVHFTDGKDVVTFVRVGG